MKKPLLYIVFLIGLVGIAHTANTNYTSSQVLNQVLYDNALGAISSTNNYTTDQIFNVVLDTTNSALNIKISTTSSIAATQISVSTTNFANNLSNADVTVQIALDTLDDKQFARKDAYNSFTSSNNFVGLVTMTSTTISGTLYSTGTITSGGALAGTTLDTGQGANELYAMDQNIRTTDSPTFSNETITYGIGMATANVTSLLTVSSVSVSGTVYSTGTITSGGAIAGTTLDTGQGANELYAMDQNVRTTDSPTFAGQTITYGMSAATVSISGLATIASGSFSGTVYATGTITSGGALAGTTLDTGQGANELYAMDQNVRTTDSPTFALIIASSASLSGTLYSTGTITSGGALAGTTLDTGQGANELYSMNQNVRTTDSPTFAGQTITYGVSATTGTFDTIYVSSIVGTSPVYFQNDISLVGNNIINVGTVDSRDVSIDGTNLDQVRIDTGTIQAQVNNIATSTGTLKTQIDSVAVSTGTMQTQVNNIATSTGTIQTQVNSIATSTGTIQTQVNNIATSTGTMQTQLDSVAVSTGTIQMQVNNIAVDTGTLRTDLTTEISNRTNADTTLGTSTATLRTDVTALQTSTGTMQTQITNIATSTGTIQTQVNNIAVDTGTLRTDMTSLQTSTGTLVKKSGDTMTGTLSGTDVSLTYGISAATGAFSGAVNLATSDGNVGIGTTGPATKAQIVKTYTLNGNPSGTDQGAFGVYKVDMTLLLTADTTRAADKGGSIGFSNNDGFVLGAIKGAATNDVNVEYGGYLGFYTTRFDSGGPYEKMRITETGKVGIGTTAPTEQLEVYDGNIKTNYGVSAATGAFSGAVNLATSSGNVGISTNTPTQALHVKGSVLIQTGDLLFDTTYQNIGDASNWVGTIHLSTLTYHSLPNMEIAEAETMIRAVRNGSNGLLDKSVLGRAYQAGGLRPRTKIITEETIQKRLDAYGVVIKDINGNDIEDIIITEKIVEYEVMEYDGMNLNYIISAMLVTEREMLKRIDALNARIAILEAIR